METSPQRRPWAPRRGCSSADSYVEGVSDLGTWETFDRLGFLHGMREPMEKCTGSDTPE